VINLKLIFPVVDYVAAKFVAQPKPSCGERVVTRVCYCCW